MSTPRSPDPRRLLQRRHCAAWALAALAAAAGAADVDVRAERARIAAERAAVEHRYAQARADCAQRFIVTSCVNEATQQRRVAIEGLNRQTLAIDESERRRLAAARLRTIDAKAAAHAARHSASAVPPAAGPLPGAQPETLIPRGAAASAPMASEPRSAAAEAATARQARAREAAARVADREQRLTDAAEHRATVERRQRERRLSGRAAAPLPPVSAARP